MLENKTIVVTGAASGIGAESCWVLKQQGATVVGVDRAPTAESVDRYVLADLSDPASIDAAVVEIGGNIDALCNIAGLPPTASAEMVLKVNVLGLRRLTETMLDNLNDGPQSSQIAIRMRASFRKSNSDPLFLFWRFLMRIRLFIGQTTQSTACVHRSGLRIATALSHWRIESRLDIPTSMAMARWLTTTARRLVASSKAESAEI